LKKQIETVRDSYELNYFACKSIEFIVNNQDYIKDVKKKILDTKKRWYDQLLNVTTSFITTESNKFKVYDSKGYVLRLYSEDKELIKRVYDNLYENKIVVSIVDDKNLVFSVIDNSKIEKIFFNEVGITQGLVTGWYQNGQQKFEGTSKNKKREGLWIEWYENGQKKEEGNYSDGKIMGTYTYYNEDGEKIRAVHYNIANDGFHEEPEPEELHDESTSEMIEDGVFRKYWTNGNIRYEWGYKNGKRVDVKSRGWYENGQLKQVTNWKNEKQNGLHTQYYKNGNKAKEFTYKDGGVTGIKRNWYENGQIDDEMYITGSVPHEKATSWYNNSQKRSEGNYEFGKKVGNWTYWDKHGNILDE
jgi:antitoxin component YwqK of YwqJK toxin-antitoxin module